MKLLIVSNMAHYPDGGAIVCPWRAAIGEIDALASIASEVRHVAALHPGEPPPGSMAYRGGNVRLKLLPAVGGLGWRAKSRVLAATASWRRVLREELEWADAVQVRAPCNIALVALGLLAVRRKPERRWVKYAGQWRGRRREPLSYWLQRAILRTGLIRAWIGVNEPDAVEGSVRCVANPSFRPLPTLRRSAEVSGLSWPGIGWAPFTS